MSECLLLVIVRTQLRRGREFIGGSELPEFKSPTVCTYRVANIYVFVKENVTTDSSIAAIQR